VVAVRLISLDHVGLLQPHWLPPEDSSWLAVSACANTDRDLWFSFLPADIQLARETCAGCPVQDECLDYSLHDPPATQGIWCGLTWEERSVIYNAPQRWVKCWGCGDYFWRESIPERQNPNRCGQC
jgi:WhiB family transcriptional regulator, redox-sensing transcriptional regulator